MSSPVTHVDEALKLEADAEVPLFQLYPLSGGTIYFKPDNTLTWQTHEYEGLPCSLTGEEKDTNKTPMPRLQIGQEDLDLLAFKGLVHAGNLDGATLVRHVVLLDDLINDINVKKTTYFRIKQVEHYSRTNISAVLATFSGAINQTVPFRQYIPPDFPWVDL